MSAYIDMILACDVLGCDNESSTVSDNTNLPPIGVHQYLRAVAHREPKAWRLIDGHDVCYKHSGQTAFQWEPDGA